MTDTDRPARKRRTDRERALEELRRARARLADQHKRAAAARTALAAVEAPLAGLEARVAHLEADPALAEIDGQTSIDDAQDDRPAAAEHEHLWTMEGSCDVPGCPVTVPVNPDDSRLDRKPYEGTGADGARRSAEIDREEIASLPDAYDPRRRDLALSAARWDAQARRLEALDVAVYT